MALRTPPLYGRHDDRGAQFTEFGGWEMPVEFDSIRTEHAAVREAAGVFDVSHMGEIEVGGPDAERLMQRLTTNDVTALDPGDAQYSAITDDEGVMLDDTVVYRLPDGDDAEFLFVPNAGHDEQMYERWTEHRDANDLTATVDNVTGEYGMVAVQGPDAPDLVAQRAGDSVLDLGRFEAAYADVAGVECWVANTGYTGEDGFEVVFPADGAGAVWDAFANDCQPCGLGARDTLRMEVGLLLSGQDFHPEENPRTPYEAGVGFVVDLDTEFVGCDRLAAQQEAGVDETFVGFVLDERGVPRHGYDITNEDGDHVGEVTSGTMSPTLDEPIGLGYVDVDYADDGTPIEVVVRGTGKRATITPTPFIDS
ncbi:glycine cleavage system aminomethyltransferase GcvT [Halobacterium sp. CBA1126]|uniref:glycine cleavage system aminomethyltransferase GcvT n=1 Tax=Halobacterium sp. CBA1126 TaxID=2668074 RepID=UPI0012F7F297|nr:glycine cleavage system aminomethyltransferase GcvT [Halobacterium sp. CBA1126]MUV60164.1 glycine cleavage system aminomethyltransferase GcvT [Halobacterium sp. CBA1126]